MMKLDWLITFRSVTFAQRGERALKKVGIDAFMHRAPRELSANGCGYCLRLQGKHAQGAMELLREQEIPFGKLYAIRADGTMEERFL